jgi:aryl-alcohol dehydrogenase-like predicted oxidoreductase
MATRRQLLTTLGATTMAASLPVSARAAASKPKAVIPKRTLGKTGHMVTPLALGGQGALQWTPPGTDPADIIVRAVEIGVNYLDTSNVYGESQLHYGEAFRRMNLVPGQSGYDAALRKKLFLATKTTRRFARSKDAAYGQTAVDDLKRSLTQIFGDGKGNFPEDACLDSMQMHALGEEKHIAQLYSGMKERGGRMPEEIGALAALLDYRDGTNYTGLNPQNRRWIRHVGLSGHLSSPVLMKMLRLDEGNDIDTLLVALNVADTQYLPHQNNVLPLAAARGMGVIAMKVFADAALLGKGAHWTRGPQEVVTTVGHAGSLDYRDMIRYTLSLPGVSCAIIGIGHIDRKDPSKDQLVANLAAAIDEPMTEAERGKLEQQAVALYGSATTNYFQAPAQGLVQPTEVKLTKTGERFVVSWQAGYAGAKPIRTWRIRTGGKTVLTIPFRSQLTMSPLTAYLTAEQAAAGNVEVIASETE